MSQKLIEGEVIERTGTTDPAMEIKRLRDLMAHLTAELNAVQAENAELKRSQSQFNAPVLRLRKQIEPLYRALQSVFGDIEAIYPESESMESPIKSAASATWESWKSRMPGAPAKVIDALLLHKEASTEQLVVLTGISRKKTIYDAANRMKRAGILNANGGRYSLKQVG